MIGSSAIVGWVAENGVGQIKQYRLKGQDPSSVLHDDGDLPLVKKSLKAFTQSSRIYLAFQLTAQPSNQLIYSVGPSEGSIPVSPDYQLTQHLDARISTVTYASGNSSSQTPTDSQTGTQADTCTNNVDFSKLAGFETTSFKCQTVWESESFVLRYGNDSDTWSFLLSAPDQSSYVGIGFSSNGLMVGTSAMVGWSGSAPMVKQYSLGGKDLNSVNADEGNLPLVANSLKAFTQSSRVYLAFQLKTSSQPSSRLIYSVGPSGYIPVSPSFPLTAHRSRISTSIDYATGQVSALKVPYQKLKRAHGGINMFAWGIMMPIGVIVARYFKRHDPTWFYSHISIQITAFILGLTGIILGFVLEDRVSTVVKHHKGIGISVLFFACAQLTALFLRPKKDAKYRVYWNFGHHMGGRILLILAVANIFYGIDLANESVSWTIGYAIVSTLIFSAAVFLQVKKQRED